MVNSCCVPLCHTKSTREKELSFHRFPKCELMKKAWLVKMRRDEGESFTVSEHTRVFSLQFMRAIIEQHLVAKQFSWTMQFRQYFPRQHQSNSGCQGQVHLGLEMWERKNHARTVRRRTVISHGLRQCFKKRMMKYRF